MKARVISTRYPRIVGEGDESYRERHDFGDVIDVTKEELDRGIELGVLQPEDEPAPPADWTNAKTAAEAGIATQPSGDPITDLDGEPLSAPAGTPLAFEEWKAPKKNADADRELAALGLTAPAGAKLKDKVAILEEYRAAAATAPAGAPPTPPPATEDIAELDDGELIERGVDFGLSEVELVDLDRGQLILTVAEAMNRQAVDPAEQQRLADGELARIRDENTAENNPEA